MKCYLPILRRISAKLTEFLVLVTFVCGLTISQSAQQETGQINGSVKDTNGAVIANATVTARNIGTSLERTATTDSEGFYAVPNLQPGAYEITATAQGFSEAKRTIQVTVGSRLTVDLQAGVADVTSTVEVLEGTGLGEINTTDQQVSDLITGRQILNLPSLDRNPYNLINLSGNISTAGALYSTNPRGVNGVSVNGQRDSTLR